MNCLLFPKNSEMKLAAPDSRLDHIRKVLKMSDGDEIFAGQIDGKLYVCTLRTNADFSEAELVPQREIPQAPVRSMTLVVAFARPAIAQRILFEASCFGVENLVFYPASKGEADYAKSLLYTGDNWRDWLVKGAEQACAVRLPKFYIASSLADALKKADELSPLSQKIAPDPYEATAKLSELPLEGAATLVLGSERGFSNPDRKLLRDSGYTLVSLSPRILRTDTAVISSLTLCFREK